MKKILLTFLFGVLANFIFAQDFITSWNLANFGPSPTQISFGVGTTGICSYTWQTIPAGANGSGTFSGNTLTITGLPANATIQLNIDTTNFNRIQINSGQDTARLLDVEQWGGVHWVSMQDAFNGCYQLDVSATDIPDLSVVYSLERMFKGCSTMSGPTNINLWNTGNVTKMNSVFFWATQFNQPVGNWNTTNVTRMDSMFYGNQSFNQPIGNWNTSNVTDLNSMFCASTDFNQPIGNWNTSSVTDMGFMFTNAISFNQPIDNWNTTNVTNMYFMFSAASNFNQPIGNWNTGSVTDMGFMFANNRNFNQPIGSWNTSSVTDMSFMFSRHHMILNYNKFNQDLSGWNTSSVVNFQNIFLNANLFNQSLANWQLNPSVDLQNMLDSCGMDCTNYSATLSGWSANINTPINRQLGAEKMQYSANAQGARDSLVNIKGWTISGDLMTNGPVCWPLNSSEIGDKRDETLEVYPNPASTKLYTKTESKELRALYSSVGQLLISTPENEIEVSNYPSGVYYLKCGNQTKKVLIE